MVQHHHTSSQVSSRTCINHMHHAQKYFKGKSNTKVREAKLNPLREKKMQNILAVLSISDNGIYRRPKNPFIKCLLPYAVAPPSLRSCVASSSNRRTAAQLRSSIIESPPPLHPLGFLSAFFAISVQWLHPMMQ